MISGTTVLRYLLACIASFVVIVHLVARMAAEDGKGSDQSMTAPAQPYQRVCSKRILVAPVGNLHSLFMTKVVSRARGDTNFLRLLSDGGKLSYLQLELVCFQLSFLAYSPLMPLLDALSHCKQKSSNSKQKS